MWFCTVSATFRATSLMFSGLLNGFFSMCWKISAPKTAYKMSDKMRKTWGNKRQNSFAHLLFESDFRPSSTSSTGISQSFREAIMSEEMRLSSHGSVGRSRMNTTPLQKQATDLNCLFNLMFNILNNDLTGVTAVRPQNTSLNSCSVSTHNWLRNSLTIQF